MDVNNILSIIISILGSSVITLVLSVLIFNPLQEKRQYIFNEKKRVYDSIIIFAQIVLYPEEAKYSLGVISYNIQELSDEENIKNAMNDLKMAIPKLYLITKNNKVIENTQEFIKNVDEESFNRLLEELRKDLYK
ncbi:hypothetical protein C805_03012 [Eubacterium sp. 14-2]|uniref:hypothetical protein n=1 Tax=Eubacterium sp. 14-2 TaxID=1235790 RepID=UPI000340AB4B|nr:hypothetical protein [Eubacterium sp. 14-2]EOT23353.1 hypothetical protein C805_03012 [Eubacterium sp. 14-2]